MHTDQIVPQQWMLVPRVTRERLVHVFNLGKSGITEVHNEDVVSDGRTTDDLRSITREAMVEYVGSEETFGRLWELSIAKAHSELNPPVGVIMSKEQQAAASLNAPPATGNAPETPEDRAYRIKMARIENMKKVHAAAKAKRDAKKAAEAVGVIPKA